MLGCRGVMDRRYFQAVALRVGVLTTPGHLVFVLSLAVLLLFLMLFRIFMFSMVLFVLVAFLTLFVLKMHLIMVIDAQMKVR